MLDVEVALGEGWWPRTFGPGCPHPSPLPPSGRGDVSIVGEVVIGGCGGGGLGSSLGIPLRLCCRTFWARRVP